MIVAIDGPSASGKSTTAKRIAEILGFIHIDTGAMYRAVTLYCLEQQIAADDDDGLDQIFDSFDYQLDNEGRIFLNGKEIQHLLRTEEIDLQVSPYSANPLVRRHLVDIQRKLAENQDVVMEGRDIGTQVFPQAEIKIFIIADVKVRAERRYLEMKTKGMDADLEDIHKDLIRRDRVDSTRTHSPLKKADDAVIIDTTHLTIKEQVMRIVEIVKTKQERDLRS